MEVVQILLNAGADVNLQEPSDGMTGLMVAVLESRMEMVKFLINANADLNIQDNAGRTALMLAVNYSRDPFFGRFVQIYNTNPDSLRFVQMFLTAGADGNIRDNHGRSALSMALDHGRSALSMALDLAYDIAPPRNQRELVLALLPHVTTLTVRELQRLRQLLPQLTPIEITTTKLPTNHPLYADFQARKNRNLNIAQQAATFDPNRINPNRPTRINPLATMGDAVTLLPSFLDNNDMQSWARAFYQT